MNTAGAVGAVHDATIRIGGDGRAVMQPRAGSSRERPPRYDAFIEGVVAGDPARRHARIDLSLVRRDERQLDTGQGFGGGKRGQAVHMRVATAEQEQALQRACLESITAVKARTRTTACVRAACPGACRRGGPLVAGTAPRYTGQPRLAHSKIEPPFERAQRGSEVARLARAQQVAHLELRRCTGIEQNGLGTGRIGQPVAKLRRRQLRHGRVSLAHRLLDRGPLGRLKEKQCPCRGRRRQHQQRDDARRGRAARAGDRSCRACIAA